MVQHHLEHGTQCALDGTGIVMEHDTHHEHVGMLSLHGSMKVLEGSAKVLCVDDDDGP
jgi:hypothetical protein